MGQLFSRSLSLSHILFQESSSIATSVHAISAVTHFKLLLSPKVYLGGPQNWTRCYFAAYYARFLYRCYDTSGQQKHRPEKDCAFLRGSYRALPAGSPVFLRARTNVLCHLTDCVVDKQREGKKQGSASERFHFSTYYLFRSGGVAFTVKNTKKGDGRN